MWPKKLAIKIICFMKWVISWYHKIISPADSSGYTRNQYMGLTHNHKWNNVAYMTNEKKILNKIANKIFTTSRFILGLAATVNKQLFLNLDLLWYSPFILCRTCLMWPSNGTLNRVVQDRWSNDTGWINMKYSTAKEYKNYGHTIQV